MQLQWKIYVYSSFMQECVVWENETERHFRLVKNENFKFHFILAILMRNWFNPEAARLPVGAFSPPHILNSIKFYHRNVISLRWETFTCRRWRWSFSLSSRSFSQRVKWNPSLPFGMILNTQHKGNDVKGAQKCSSKAVTIDRILLKEAWTNMSHCFITNNFWDGARECLEGQTKFFTRRSCSYKCLKSDCKMRTVLKLGALEEFIINLKRDASVFIFTVFPILSVSSSPPLPQAA